MSLQNTLNKVFSQLQEIHHVTTASAYCQAREKLRPEIFIHLNEIVGERFYQTAQQVQSWHGHRLVGADGSYLNLPDTRETRKVFSVQENQYKDGACVQALAMVLYDLGNDLGLAAQLGRRQGETKLLLTPSLWEATKAGDVLVVDRGFADYLLLATAAATGREVIVRLPRRRWQEATKEFWESRMTEQTVEVKCPAGQRGQVKQEQLAERLKLRLIRVELEEGEEEILATTLIDKEKYRAEEFKQVYGWRWREETYFGRLKRIFEVERFSGHSVHTIKQDFYAVMFLASLEAVLGKSDGEALAEKSGEKKKNGAYRINRSVSYLALVDRVVELLMGEKSSENVLEEIHQLFRMGALQERKGKQNKRKKGLRYAALLRYHKYYKRDLA